MSQEADWVRVYQSSRYAYLDGGRWQSFALDGKEGGDSLALRVSVTLITAWNPDSADRPLPENEAANGRLLRQVVAQGLSWGPAFGASLPGVEPAWREEGYALFGLDRAAACRWGRAWGQRAVVWLDSGASELLFCQAEEAVACRLRTLESNHKVLPFGFSA